MVNRYLLCAASLAVILSASGYGDMASDGRAEQAEAVVALPENRLPAPLRQPLPGRDCLTCPGPPATAPCFATHRGFLYYGTYPWDDDRFNGFNDCPQGQCGYPGAALSLAWIRLHQGNGKQARHPQPSTGSCPTCVVVPHYFPSGQFPSGQPQAVDPQTGATH